MRRTSTGRSTRCFAAPSDGRRPRYRPHPERPSPCATPRADGFGRPPSPKVGEVARLGRAEPEGASRFTRPARCPLSARFARTAPPLDIGGARGGRPGGGSAQSRWLGSEEPEPEGASSSTRLAVCPSVLASLGQLPRFTSGEPAGCGQSRGRPEVRLALLAARFSGRGRRPS